MKRLCLKDFMTAPESNHSLTNLNVLRRNNLLCNADFFFFLIETVGNNGLTLDTAVSRGIYLYEICIPTDGSWLSNNWLHQLCNKKVRFS